MISSIQLVEYLAEQYFFLITGLTVIFILFPLLDRPCLFPFFLLKKMTFYNAFLNQTLRSLPRTAKNYSTIPTQVLSKKNNTFTASYCLIGDEILNGKTRDSNAYYLGNSFVVVHKRRFQLTMLVFISKIFI